MGLLDIGSFFTGLIINLLLISLICYYFKRKYENLEESLNEQAKILYELLERDKNIKEESIEKLYKVENLNDMNSVETDDGEVGDDEEVGDDDTDDSDDCSVNDNSEDSLNKIDTSGVKFIDMVEVDVENSVVSSLDIKVLKEDDETNKKSEELPEEEEIKETQTLDETNAVDVEPMNEESKGEYVELTEENKEDDVEVPDDEDEDEIYDETNADNNYNKMSVKELRNILSVKGVNVSSKMKKNELLSLIHGKKSLIIDMALEDN